MFHNASYRPTPVPAPSGAVARHLLFTSCSSRGYPSRSPTLPYRPRYFRIDFSGDKNDERGLSDFSSEREIGIVIDFIFFSFFFFFFYGGRKSWRVAERNKCRVTARRFVNGSTSRGGKQITRTSRSKEKGTTDPSVENKFETVLLSSRLRCCY